MTMLKRTLIFVAALTFHLVGTPAQSADESVVVLKTVAASAAFSPDGTKVLTAGNREVRIWNAELDGTSVCANRCSDDSGCGRR
jgi:hypothetical protein